MGRSLPVRKTGLVIGLTAVAGFVDAVGFLVLRGLFTAHMSGNAAQFGVNLGRGNLAAAVPLLVAIGIFLLGCAAGGAISELASRRRLRSRDAPALALQTLLLLGFTIYGASEVGSGAVSGTGTGPFYVLAALAIGAIGLQAATITEVGGATIRTAYISGVLTRLGQGAGRWLVSTGIEERAPLRLLGAIVVTYLASATLGSLLHHAIGIWAIGVPVLVLIVAIAEDLRRPFEDEEMRR